MPRRPPILASLAMLSAALGAAAVAHAHSIELTSAAAVDPADPTRIALLYGGYGVGVLHSDDAGDTWRAMCADAIDPEQRLSATSLGQLEWLAHAGLYLTGTAPSGLHHDDGTGCNWSRIERFDGKWITGLATHPREPGVLFVTTVRGDEPRSVLHRRGADGSWEVLDEVATLVVDLAAVAHSEGPPRLYQVAVRFPVDTPADGGSQRPVYSVRVSDDLAESWVEHPQGESGEIRIAAVDPTDPDRILIVVATDDGLDRLRLSQDAGETFTDWLGVGQLGAVAVAPDGRLWVGDSGDPIQAAGPGGLYAADGFTERPRLLDDSLQVECLLHLPEPERLLLCERTSLGFVDLTTGTYRRTFVFTELAEMLDCPGRDLCGECEESFQQGWCSSVFYPSSGVCTACGYCDQGSACVQPPDVHGNPTTDAGHPVESATAEDAGSPVVTGDAAASEATGRHLRDGDRLHGGGCGCRAPGGSPHPGAGLLAVLALLALGPLRARRARRSRR